MSTFQATRAVTMTVGGNLNGALYEALTVNASGQVVRVSTATQVIVGVLGEEPGRVTTAGADTVPVILLHGIILAKVGATVTPGQIAVSNGATTNGTLTGVAGLGNLAVDQMGVGVFLEGGTAGQVVRMLAMPIGAPHSA